MKGNAIAGSYVQSVCEIRVCDGVCAFAVLSFKFVYAPRYRPRTLLGPSNNGLSQDGCLFVPAARGFLRQALSNPSPLAVSLSPWEDLAWCICEIWNGQVACFVCLHSEFFPRDCFCPSQCTRQKQEAMCKMAPVSGGRAFWHKEAVQTQPHK